MKKSIVLLITMLWLISAFSQETSLYMPGEIARAYENGTRSKDGKPGNNYWVNTADYVIDAKFNPESLEIKGKEKITYYNNSPDTLSRLVLKLKQNFYKKGAFRDSQISEENVTDGVQVNNIMIHHGQGEKSEIAGQSYYGTLLFIRLKKADFIPPGTSITFSLDWELKMPGHLESRSGKIHDDTYFISYWFPQMSVYDDISGWDRNSYTGVGETYNDKSDYEVNISVPNGYVVWATGELQNPQDFFTPQFLDLMDKSKTSDDIYHLAIPDVPYNSFLKASTSNAWKYKAKQVPDFAFALSSNYLWDATSAVKKKQTGERTWINIIYPESADLYKMGAGIAQKAIEYFSDKNPGIVFPYSKQVTVYGDFSAGMEFPMMALDGDMGNDTSDFYDLIAHEIAHTYFPFSVNTNEKMYAWMDESWTTMFGVDFTMSNGLTKPPFFANLDKAFWDSFRDIPPMVPTTNVKSLVNMHIAYIRPKFSILFLMEMFEEKGLELPTQEYFSRWDGKHPTPYDFFFTMNNLFGEDLSWYFKPWFFEFCSPDLAIEKVVVKGNMIKIDIKNPGKMPLPVKLTIHYADGASDKVVESAYLWKDGVDRFGVDITIDNKIEKIVLGDENIPDVHPEDNVWVAR